jgi:hypothetical protein
MSIYIKDCYRYNASEITFLPKKWSNVISETKLQLKFSYVGDDNFGLPFKSKEEATGYR